MENFTDGGFRLSESEPENEQAGAVPSKRIIPDGEIPWQIIPDISQDEVEADDTEAVEETDDISARFPAQVISGVAGEFARLYAQYIEPPEEFLFLAFLTCLGAAAADRLTLASEIKQQPRLYTLLLGESADVRKSTAISKTVKLFQEAYEEFSQANATSPSSPRLNVLWGVGSAEGLQRALKEMSPLLLVLDELKAFLGKCRVQASVLLPCVNTLFEQNNYRNKTVSYDIELDNVHLGLVGACTLETYERAWDESFTDIGFTNRIFIVPASGKKRFSLPREIPEAEKRKVKFLLEGIFRLIGESLVLGISESARRVYDEWYQNLDQSIHSKRLDTYAVRFMLLLAVNEFKVEIDEEIVKKAIALADWQLAMRRQYDPIDAETKVAEMEQRIMRRLRIRPHTDRELRQFCNASRSGIRIYRWAVDNLKSVGEVSFDSDAKVWRCCDSLD